MKKVFTTVVGTFLITIGTVKAQALASGVNDVYAERFQSAKATFEKLIAANPNDIDATYWLGQTYIEMDDVNNAQSVYQKGLTSSSNAPLLQAGMGEVELIQNKINEARQHFEAAITASGSKKGNDPAVLNAVGKAITEVYSDKDKKGDINYAVQKLEEASQSKTKDNILLADIYVNLGNAYLKAKPGENGGQAFSSYQKAIEANPAFPVPYYKMAQLFKTQKNWELYEKYLNDAVAKDPRFAPAYYDLSYFKMGKLDLPAAESFAKKFSDASDPDPQNEYLRASILFAQKNYDQAMSIGQSIISRLGDKTKARVYKLMAYSLLGKKDSTSAKDYVDKFFTKEKPDKVVALDYKLKADVYSAIPGQEAVVLQSYLDGLNADTVLDNKLDLLKQGSVYFSGKKQYDKEAVLEQKILEIKPNVTLNDMFNAGLAYYRMKTSEGYISSYNIFKTVAEKFPDQSFGWEWKYNNAIVIDTVKKDSIAVPDAQNLLTFAQKDTVKYAKQISNASFYLANYYLDVKKDKDKAIQYLTMMKNATPDQAMKDNIQHNIELLQKQPPPRQQQPQRATAPTRGTSGGGGAGGRTQR